MNARLHPAPRHVLPAHTLLFARYVAGQIAEPAWQHISSVFDGEVASPVERDAFATFLSDACSELGPDALNVPRLEEVEEILTFSRLS